MDAFPDNAPHTLVVDDDQRIRELLTKYLVKNGFRVTPSSDALAARAAMRGLTFDVIVLDIMMPGENGLELARALKKETQIPVCMLTAQSNTKARIKGLEAGVDDYIPKPFEPRELLLRLQNILRREQKVCNITEIKMGVLTFCSKRGELRRGGEIMKLTERERDLLKTFAKRPDSLIERHELNNNDQDGSKRVIDVQINRLRRKIEADPSNPVYLQTVRGKGYILHTD
ncbi:MAG: response regulator transcription factor [Hyphomicrobiaceae bacterium]|nr:response regulator transcription factor [Hyphomicrobiaceae bacterium]